MSADFSKFQAIFDSSQLIRGVAGEMAADTGRDPRAILSYLYSSFQPIHEDDSTSRLRTCITDPVILSQIGDLTLNGVNDQNNILVSVQVLNPSVTQAQLTSIANTGTNSPTIFPATYFTTVQFYTYGNHHTEDRIARYWQVLVARFFLGDSIAHAHYVAKQAVLWMQNANNPEADSQWQWITENQFTGGIADETSAVIDADKNADYLKLLKACLVKVILENYQTGDPDLYAEESLEKGLSATFVVNTPPSLVAHSSNWMLYAGSVGILLGFYMLTRKGKTSS